MSESVDFVMYWWHLAAKASEVRRFGFITTNSITQVFNRSVIEAADVRLIFAIPDHPWVDGGDGADVRIAMTTAGRAASTRLLQIVRAEGLIPDGYGERWVELRTFAAEMLNSDLTVGVDVDSAVPLVANAELAVQGMNPLGLGFRLEPDELETLNIAPGTFPNVLKPYMIGRDIVQRHNPKWVIDFYGRSEREAANDAPPLFQHILNTVKPESAYEKDSQGCFGVIHRVSDPRCEPTPNAEEEAACEAELRH